MNDLKDFLTSTVTPGESQEFNDRMKQINDQFVSQAPILTELMSNIQQGKETELETRAFQVSMPPSFWRAFEAFAEVFEKRVEYGIHDPSDPADVIQDNITRVFSKVTNNAQTIVLSQMILDAVVSFTATMHKAKFLEGLEKVIASGDPDQIVSYLRSQHGEHIELIDDDSDPDSED